MNSTSVSVSWDVLIILSFPIDYYTVVYSPLCDKEDGKMTTMFLPPATSGIINDLSVTEVYQFQVFATVKVDGVLLEGERSVPVYFRGSRKKL